MSRSDAPNAAPAFTADASLRTLSGAWRSYKRTANPGGDTRPAIRVAVAGNYATQFLTQALELALVERGFAPQLYEAGYNQYELELANPESALSAFKPDVIVLTLTSQLLCLRAGPGQEIKFAGQLARLVNTAAARLSAKVIITLPEPLEEEIEQTGWARQWRRTLNARLEEQLDGAVCTLHLDSLISMVGAANWFSPRYYATSKLPFAPDHSARFGDYLARYVAGAMNRPVRLVITDLDDTMWGGTVGEIGWENVDLDAEGTGYGFLRLQHFLRGLHEAGVLLAICSKNEPENALNVFRNRPEMILREEHFAARRINWKSKSENIVEILDELNLTEPGCVFLDDNPLERREVSHRLNHIWIPELAEDPNERTSMLANSGHFTLPVSTSDDRKRQEMYRAERERRDDAQRIGSIEDYYKSLELKLTPARPDQGNWQRILDLIRKTNQFNLTTIRHTSQDLQGFVSSDENEVWAYSLADKYGEYGLISVLIGVREQHRLEIRSWVMSCRAMGRTVERAVFAHIADRARQSGIDKIIGRYVPTVKNTPVSDLYPQLGFIETGREGPAVMYECDLTNHNPAPPYVALQSSV